METKVGTANPKNNNTDCLLVLGMHRSGTSVVSGCLHHLGIELGENLIGAHPSNEMSHWEHQDLVVAHDILLRDLGCRWDMIGRLPSGWEQSEAAEKARNSIRSVLEREFPLGKLWAVKDPRLCRLIPLWLPLLQELGLNPGFLITLRHPWEVACSLQKQDSYDLLKAHLLWVTYYREALEACQGKSHTLLLYDQLLADPIRVLREAAKQLGITYPRSLEQRYPKILEFVHSDLKHHHASNQGEKASVPAAFAHFAQLYDELRFRCQAGAEQKALSKAQIRTKTTASSKSKRKSVDQAALFSQSGPYGENIFEDFLFLLGDFERATYDLKLQKDRWIFSNKRQAHRALYAQIFFPSPADDSYTEEHSVKMLLPQEEWEQISISIPNPILLREKPLRFSPLNTKGMISLSSIKLVNAATGQVCWSADKSVDFEACQLHHVLRLAGEASLLLMVYGPQPQIRLPILPDLPDCPLELQAWLRVSTNQQPIVDIWQQEQQQRQQLKKALDSTSQQEEALTQELMTKGNALAEVTEREHMLKETVAEHQRQLAAQTQQLSNMEAEAREHRQAYERELQAKAQSLAEMTEREHALKETVAEHQRQLAAQTQQLNSIETESWQYQQVYGRELQVKAQALAAAFHREGSLKQILADKQHQLAEQEQTAKQALTDMQCRLAEQKQTTQQALTDIQRQLTEQKQTAAVWKNITQQYRVGFQRLERDYLAVKESARWRVGNRLIRGIELLLLRKKPRLAMDHMQGTFETSKTWQPSPLPYMSSEPGQDLKQLQRWLKQLEHGFQALLYSKRWKFGNALIRTVEIALFQRKEPLAVDHMQHLFNEYNAWSPMGGEQQDISQLSLWMDRIRNDFQALLESKRWQAGDLTFSTIDKILLRGRPPMVTDHMQEIWAQFKSWQSNRQSSLNEQTNGPVSGQQKKNITILPLSSKSKHTDSASIPSPPSSLNIVFVLPQPLDSNCGYHAQSVATVLSLEGVDCLFAVPGRGPSDQAVTKFRIQSFSEIREKGLHFRNGRGPTIIHAWTPREIVRKFCVELQSQYPSKLVIHLEDNEEYLTEVSVGKTWQELNSLPLQELKHLVPESRFHPVHGPAWLARADGLTYVIDTLRQFNTAQLPSLVLPPIVDERRFYPRPLNITLRQKLGIPEEHGVLVYSGNVHAANLKEVGFLYQAVELLNQQGCPTTLIRTGKDPDSIDKENWPRNHVTHLGWVTRNELPEILAAADFFVQPGVPDLFNDLRLPSKLPEYFAMGRPVILPKTNLGLETEHGRDAYVLDKADEQGIAEAVQRLKAEKGLNQQLVLGAATFYRIKLNNSHLGERLGTFYKVELSSFQTTANVNNPALAGEA